MYNQFHNPAVEERMSKSVFMQLEMAAGLRASFSTRRRENTAPPHRCSSG
jgi:hypothetical protein